MILIKMININPKQSILRTRRIKHSLARDGDSTEIRRYLLSEGFTHEEILNPVIWLTKIQHKRIGELEVQRFDNYNKTIMTMDEQMNKY